MKLTVLQYVQKALSEMDSDAVDSISDTVESVQVADLLEDIFFDLMGTRNWSHLRELLQLNALADVNRPNYMRMPDSIKEIEIISYNIRKAADTKDKMVPIPYVEANAFLTQVNARKSDGSNIQVVQDFSLVNLNIFNDREPTIWTTFDDDHIVFDAFNNTVDSTLQKSKSQVVVYNEPTFTVADDHVPDMPSEMVPLLLNELKARASASLAQKDNVRASAETVRQRRVVSRKEFKARGGIKVPNMARRPRKSQSVQRRNPLFDKN